MKTPNLMDYNQFRSLFDWAEEQKKLSGLPHGKGLNISYEAIDRHVDAGRGEDLALRIIRKDFSQEDFSFSRLKNLTARFANVLKNKGLLEGDRVFSLLGRVPDLYISALGSLKFKAVFCPLFSVFGPEPIFQRLSKGDAKVLVTDRKNFEAKIRGIWDRIDTLQYIFLTDIQEDVSDRILSLPHLLESVEGEFEIPPTDPENPALLHFTSGTTGMPKGALHVHRAVLTHYVTGKYVLDFSPEDIFWCTADPGWVTGTSYGIIAPLVNGVTSLVDEEEFDALRWYQILEKQKVTVWYTSPTALRRLMRLNFIPKKRVDLAQLRLVLSVGEPLNAEAVIWGQQAFGVPVLDTWWQTETGGIMISNYLSMPVKPGSMGKPLPGIEAAIAKLEENELKILDEPDLQGNLVLKKGFPSLFRGYIHEEERYRKCFLGEWYITGDLAKIDKDGYFWFIGRADDLIKTSGHLVGPFEVESTLMKHGEVSEAAVIGKPEPAIGELVKAFVVLKEGIASSEDLKMELIGFARKNLGPAVAPKEIEFVTSLPKTKSGKILRRLLKARELGLPEGDLSTLERD
jgi:acetyl-CoA synthetase